MYSSVLLFLNIGTPELLLILFVALLLFGGEKLPELARGLGKGIRDFKDASEGVKREIHNQINNFEEKSVEPETTATESAVIEAPKPIVENTKPLLDQVPLVHPVTGAEDASHTIPASQPAHVTEPAAAAHTVPATENHTASAAVSNSEAVEKESK